ncbi:hypothetical protein RYX36_000131 [Vicia faba]
MLLALFPSTPFRPCLASGEEDVAIIAFEIFDELIESPAPLLGDSVKSIVQFSLEVFSTQSLESNTRHQAIQIISWLAKYKSNILKKHKLIIPILHILCPLLAESTNEDEDDDLAPDRAATEVIDTMALNIPKHVFPPNSLFSSVQLPSAITHCYPSVADLTIPPSTFTTTQPFRSTVNNTIDPTFHFNFRPAIAPSTTAPPNLPPSSTQQHHRNPHCLLLPRG